MPLSCFNADLSKGQKVVRALTCHLLLRGIFVGTIAIVLDHYAAGGALLGVVLVCAGILLVPVPKPGSPAYIVIAVASLASLAVSAAYLHKTYDDIDWIQNKDQLGARFISFCTLSGNSSDPSFSRDECQEQQVEFLALAEQQSFDVLAIVTKNADDESYMRLMTLCSAASTNATNVVPVAPVTRNDCEQQALDMVFMDNDKRIKSSLALKPFAESMGDYNLVINGGKALIYAYNALAIYTMVVELLIAIASIYEALRTTKQDSKVGAQTV